MNALLPTFRFFVVFASLGLRCETVVRKQCTTLMDYFDGRRRVPSEARRPITSLLPPCGRRGAGVLYAEALLVFACPFYTRNCVGLCVLFTCDGLLRLAMRPLLDDTV